jgi:hypothetical protein
MLHSKQMERNQKIGIIYYSKVLKINPKHDIAKQFIEELKIGTVDSWSFAAD